MNLPNRLAAQFSRNARNRGEEYWIEDRVEIVKSTESSLSAEVFGTQSYDLDLNWNGDTLTVCCDCPFFAENGLACKHIWATMLAADEQGLFAGADAVTKLVIDARPFRVTPVGVKAPGRPAPPPPGWREHLASIFANEPMRDPTAAPWPSSREIVYLIEIAQSNRDGRLVLALQTRDRKKNGEWSMAKAISLKGGAIRDLPEADDRQILSMLCGGQQYYGWTYSDSNPVPQTVSLRPDLAFVSLPLIARTGRGFLRPDTLAAPDQWLSLSWDDAEPWDFELRVAASADGDAWLLEGLLRRGELRLEPGAATVLVPEFVFIGGSASRVAATDSWRWMHFLRRTGPLRIPMPEWPKFFEHLLARGSMPPISLPPELRYEEVSGDPRPHLKIAKYSAYGRNDYLRGDLSFAYGDREFGEDDEGRGILDVPARRLFLRNQEAEIRARILLEELGAKRKPAGYGDPKPHYEISPKKMPAAVRTLVEAGWYVDAQGVVFRKPGAFNMQVSSGVDWFELHGKVDFEGSVASLPELLAALRRGENMVRLGDGTFGLLPEEWLQRIGPLAGMGETADGHIRFRPAQAGLLDALLAAQPEARCDEAFARIRAHWRDFKGVVPAAQPAGFVGRLRDYQAEGLGWMDFLRRFDFGGCLADDMGTGKTAQVLAALESRRELRAAGESIGPSLVVVPRSVVFNWKEEAARFTPQLRVLDYSQPARDKTNFADYDLVLTTYGTLRRDIVHLQNVDFDYVVLDEAQAVKNAQTVSSKAVRLLRGRHRLALSGTPVENHLGELWTLFEFLNPGMLGASSAFRGAGETMRNPSEETRRMLAHALRPFILRRTKEQVARELPAKTEQTIYCELDSSQRRLYDELRDHYRTSLLGSRSKWEQAKLQVLEALLRLRQAACHPGLLDRARAEESSAKLDVLWEQLREVREGGHKALVFSQFTSLLAIVRDRLDGEQVAYEYLDGATRDRKSCVDRFQSDDGCPLFLISLKAGGLGLNLTAAEYVFILDPWWNPAAEAQAVDRAHRIGQERPVFAYRLIARDTVEEKVLELQKTKRELADAIIGADNSLIRDLKADDLAMLLS